MVLEPSGQERRLAPLTASSARFQYFDLDWTALGRRELRLEIDGDPTPGPRLLALHYLGSRR